jgi:hypothetical protein
LDVPLTDETEALGEEVVVGRWFVIVWRLEEKRLEEEQEDPEGGGIGLVGGVEVAGLMAR